MIELQPGTLNLLTVAHDDWCGYFVTGSPESCNCVPDVEMVTVTDTNADAVAQKTCADEKRSQQLKRARRN